MYYKTSKHGQARTSGYVGTTDNPHDADIQEVREDVARHNQAVKANFEKWGNTSGDFIKLRLRPRGPRRKNKLDTLVKDARHYDVYKSFDADRTYAMRLNK